MDNLRTVHPVPGRPFARLWGVPVNEQLVTLGALGAKGAGGKAGSNDGIDGVAQDVVEVK